MLYLFTIFDDYDLNLKDTVLAEELIKATALSGELIKVTTLSEELIKVTALSEELRSQHCQKS